MFVPTVVTAVFVQPFAPVTANVYVPAAVATAFCEFVPPLKPAPDHVYVKAAGPPFKATVLVKHVMEFGDVAVGLGNAVFCDTA